MEKRSLLREEINYNTRYGSTQPTAPPPPPYVEPNSSVSNVQIETDEFPVPNVHSERVAVIPTVSCRVCKCSIDISGKADQFVVQCENCHEATPIKLAPIGKKYVRCPCNCLLICKSTSQKISCPRPNCKRIISMAPTSAFPNSNDNPGLGQVSCPHCQSSFMINTTTLVKIMRCTYCRRRVTLSHHYIKCRKNFSVFLSFLFLIAWIISLVYAINIADAIFISLSVAFLVVFFACIALSMFYFSIKPLHIEAFTEST